MLQFSYSTLTSRWRDPALVQYDLNGMQCGDTISVSYSVVVLSCQITRTITIFRRSTMSLIYQKTFTQERFYGKELHIIDKLDG